MKLKKSRLQKKNRVKKANNAIIGHLNITSFRNKFVFAEEIIQVFDIFLASESKLDNTFPTNLFKINGYKIYRYDQNQFGGCLQPSNFSIFCRGK